MKTFEMEFFHGEELIVKKQGTFVSRVRAGVMAATYARQLSEGRSQEITYKVTEVAPMDADGNLVDNPVQEKKSSGRKGGRTQKPMTFRLDDDLEPHLNAVANKGRLINTLLRRFFFPTEGSEDRPEEFNDRIDNKG